MLCRKDIICGSIGLDMRLFGNCKYTVHQPLVQFRAHEDRVVQYISKHLKGALETTRLKQMKMNLFTSYQLDAVRAVEIATLSLMTGVKAACLSISLRAMKELTDVGRGVYTIVEYKQEKVSLPTIKSIVVVYGVAVKSKSVKKSVVVEAMLGMPLSLTKNSVMKDSSLYGDGEEVLAELGVKLVVFPPSKMQKNYEVAERKYVQKNYEVAER